jgi:hypothetical protein
MKPSLSICEVGSTVAELNTFKCSHVNVWDQRLSQKMPFLERIDFNVDRTQTVKCWVFCGTRDARHLQLKWERDQ